MFPVFIVHKLNAQKMNDIRIIGFVIIKTVKTDEKKYSDAGAQHVNDCFLLVEPNDNEK